MKEIVKIVVTVPKLNADDLRTAIGKAGAGIIGNYSFCSYTVTGTGRFLPGEGAEPTIGIPNHYELVEEERIEVNCDRNKIKIVVDAIQANHPYEEPAIDIYPLLTIY